MTDAEGRWPHRHHHPHRWAKVTLTWTQTTTVTVPVTPEEKEVRIQVSDVSMSDSSAGESGTLSIVDAAGFDVAPASPPTWVSDDNGAFINLSAAADGMSATATPHAPGTANVTVTAVDAEGTTLTFATAVTVTAGPEAQLSVAWSPVTPVPAPPA